MLTIEIDPRHPHLALEHCSGLVELLAETFAFPRSEDISEGARSAVAALCHAVVRAQERVAKIMHERAYSEDHARPARYTATAQAATLAAMMGVPEAEAADLLGLAAGRQAVSPISEDGMAIIADAVRAARAGRAPSLTEPKAPAASKRRRAA